MISFAVLTPSRGLVHSRVVEAVMANVGDAVAAGHDFRGWRLTHDLPIPDCDNRCVDEGLRSGAAVLWFVEEDTIPPVGALLTLLERNARGELVVAIDYPVGEAKWSCIPHYRSGIPWCGLGCTLIDRRVFEQLPRPWFRTDKLYNIVGRGSDDPQLVERDDPRPNAEKWGHQDIYFGQQLAARGIPITDIPGMTASQAKVVEMGRRESNVGWHRIEIVSQIERQQ